jgi:hypothetical protein
MSAKCINKNICVNRKELNRRLSHYISDDDLKQYFGQNFNKHIVKYGDLDNYKSIYHLLPKDKSFVIILIEFEESLGHWVMASRYDKTIEFFNSYGGKPSKELDLIPDKKRIELDECVKHLNILLTKALKSFHVIYNKTQFQSLNTKISTCGRHCIVRAIIQQFDLNLQQYINFMKKLKNDTGLDFDEIVAIFIK